MAGNPHQPEPAEPVLVQHPLHGTPPVISTPAELDDACQKLADAAGPVAIDTERASGYRYWPKAYLIQLRRQGTETFLIDPIPLTTMFKPLASVLNEAEWILHAAPHDLPCLAELGLFPKTLFDTDLAARLAGYPRVALGTLVEELLGYRLEKRYSRADWSQRPLPQEWLDYAALDVEFLIPLREKLTHELTLQEKLSWAEQEFAGILQAPPPEPKEDPWRGISGIHRLRNNRQLAEARALWLARNELAQQLDRAPHRILPDSAIIAAVTAKPRSVAELQALPVFGGPNQRKYSTRWLTHLRAARALPVSELPSHSGQPGNGPPRNINRWKDKNPDAVPRLAAIRAILTELAEKHNIPAQNLVLPELIRRIAWRPPSDYSVPSVAAALSDGGARPWQVDVTAAAISAAIIDPSHVLERKK